MNEMGFVHFAIVMILLGLLFNVLRTQVKSVLVREAGWWFLVFSLVSLVISLVIRSQTAEYFALSNMYESMLFLIIWLHVAYLVMDRWFSLPSLGWPVCMLLLVELVYDISLPTDIRPLQAALQSYWRAIHVPVIILSYAMFTLAFISSVIYLVKQGMEKGGGAPGGAMLAAEGMPMAFQGETAEEKVGSLLSKATREGDVSLQYGVGAVRGDGASIYDEITYRCVAIGFPLLTIGIILGGMWANEAWGNYWSWDPKESMSLVTLLGYGVYLHMRVNGEHSQKTLAYVSVIGFVLMLVTYFGVNMMGLGLHSYGKIGG